MRRLYAFLTALVIVVSSMAPMTVVAGATGADSVVATKLTQESTSALVSTGQFAGGSGTEADPYLIETKEHLNNVRNYPTAHFKMVADVIFTDADFTEGGAFYNAGLGWTPIGVDRTTPFSGVFDGNAHRILGLKINFSGTTLRYIGVFGYVTGIIRNLGVVNCSITANSDSVSLYVGGIAGYNSGGTISCCYAVSVISSDYDSGGIVGCNWGTVERCFNDGAVSSDYYAGGIVSSNYSLVANSYNSGIVTSDSYAGGISSTNNGTIEYCYNIGAIDASKYCGGLAGKNSDILASSYYYEGEHLGSGNGVDTAVRCTIEEMQRKSTYSLFDFENIWKIDVSSKYPFPSLQDVDYAGAQDNTAEFKSGTGTIWDPYIVETKAHLNNVRKYLDSHFLVISDITLLETDFSAGGAFYNDGKGWIPIGTKELPFSGTFNGGGCTISGITINVGVEQDLYVGLFGYSKGKIQNVNIAESNITITGDSTKQSTDYDHAYIGSVVGYGNADSCNSSGTIIINCKSSARSCYVYAGGIVGRGSASNCNNSGKISASVSSDSSKYAFVYLGGICGYGATISKCINTGAITASSLRNNAGLTVGGIAGVATTIVTCCNKANVTASGTFFTDVDIGGICGLGADGSSVSQAYNTGVINGPSESKAGGIIGYVGGDGNIKDSYNTGMIKGGWCGGILGSVFGSVTISNCYNAGLVGEGDKYAILGRAINSSAISNCYCLEGMAQIDTSTTLCTESEMMLQTTFRGFDFATVWQMGINTAYPWPELRGAPTGSNCTNIKECSISLNKSQVQYHTASPHVTVTNGGKTLVINEDYIAKYIIGDKTWFASETSFWLVGEIGTATILIVGIGDYVGTATTSFEVIKFDLANARLMDPWTSNGDGSYSSGTYVMKDFEYDGIEKTQSGYVVRDDKDTISAEHYEVTYRNNVEVGTATMIITGKGDYYSGTLEKTFQIYPRAIQNVEISKYPDKLTYKKGETEIDLSGGQITVHYQDGGIETHNMSSDMLNRETDLSVPGGHYVWITFGGYAVHYEITVVDITRGDANNDGKITITDMLAVKSHILGKSSLTGNVAMAADTNKDGKITITDFIQIKAHILGKSTIVQ